MQMSLGADILINRIVCKWAANLSWPMQMSLTELLIKIEIL